MKKFLSLILAELMLFQGIALASPQSSAPEYPVQPRVNLLTNGTFESGKAAWAASTPSTLTIETGSPLFGKASGKFVPTASSQTITSAQYPVPPGLQGGNCTAEIIYKTAETTNAYTLQAIDGSSNVLNSVQLGLGVSVAAPAAIAFPCGSGTVALQIVSSGSAAALYFDDATLGNGNISTISQAQLVGGVVITGCASSWSNSSTTFASLGTQTGCVYTAFGAASAPSTNVAGVKFSSLAPGEYVLIYQGQAASSSAGVEADFQFTDGTNTAREVSQVGGSVSTVGTPGFNQSISYLSSQSNVTLEIYGKNASASAAVTITGTTAHPGTIRVYRFPTQSEQGVRIETINWLVDAMLIAAGTQTAVTITPGSWTNPTNSSATLTTTGASQSVQIPCSGTNPSTSSSSCASGTQEMGIVFNVPVAQTVQVCVDFSHSFSGTGSIDQEFRLVETPNNNDASTLSGGTAVISDFFTNESLAHVIHICENFAFSSAGQKTVRLQAEDFSSGGTVSSDAILTDGGTVAGRGIHFTARPLTQNVPAPIFVGGVSTPSAGAERFARMRLVGSDCISSPCTIADQSGSWVTSVTKANTGNYLVNIAAGAFSAAPTCTCSGQSGSTAIEYCVIGGTSSSQVNVLTENTTSFTGSTDGTFSLLCQGPK